MGVNVSKTRPLPIWSRISHSFHKSANGTGGGLLVARIGFGSSGEEKA